MDRDICTRIILVGAESTGKTTLAKRLIQKYQIPWIPEFLRLFCEDKIKNTFDEKTVPVFNWTTEEFIYIAENQKRIEIEEAKKNNLIICDTDLFAVSVWHERYLGFVSNTIEEMAKKYESQVYKQIYLLTDNNVPFVQDGYRDGEHIRDWMFNRFLNKLQSENKTFYVLTGSYDERYEQAVKIIDDLISSVKNRNDR